MQNLHLGRWLVWGGFALTLLILPLIFKRGLSLSLLCQMGTVIVFALSYNMLLGQGGMLSFGHAVYSGLGAFCAIHALNLAAAGHMPVPVTLIPLVGGVAGMFFGALFGYVTTKKSGTTFAMITLGIVELVFASALILPGFFGGEGGISTNRVIGTAFLGISYGPQIQVYYLIGFWLFVSTVAMFAFTHTPLGRMLNAVRDNPERAAFVGYDPQWVRYLTLSLSAFFAGVSGALGVINFEIVSAENVSAVRSATILLFTFIGGTGFFFGPVIGAIVGVFLTVMLSSYTSAWQFYLGVLFILIVMLAPGGIAGLIMHAARLVHHGRLRHLWPHLVLALLNGLLMLSGFVMMVEMLYHLSLNAANGSIIYLFGFTLDTAHISPWLCAAVLFLLGLSGWRWRHPGLLREWHEVQFQIQNDTDAARVQS